MKFICDKATLSSAIAGVSRAVAAHSNIPILETILFHAEQGRIILTGYDLEMAITTSVPAIVSSPGEIALSAKLIGDMVRRMNTDDVEIECGENLTVTIRGGITEFTLTSQNPMDYPEMPDPGADEAVELEAQTLKQMIDTTLFAVSVDDKKPAHTGEKFVLEHDKLTLVALDGYRLAIVERPVTSNREISIIIPAKTMNEVSRLMGELDEKIIICANRRFVVFRGGDYTIISRLIDGEFIDYTRVVPVSCTTTVTVPTREFINCIERASLIITERLKNPLRIRFENNVTVRCQTTLGSVMDEIEAKVEGQAVEVGFNNRYLLDALRYSGKDEVVFQISGPLAPVKIIPTEGSDFLFLVLPVRFKNE